MIQIDHLLAFTIAATLLTVTPGLDTALVLRTAATEGGKRAILAGLGIATGCFAWGLVVAAGLGALLAASQLAYNLLRAVGAAYLLFLGVTLIRSPRFDLDMATVPAGRPNRISFRTGFTTNILNPKVGVFYVSFVPQFIPSGTNVALTTVILTAIHALLGILWFSLLVLVTKPAVRFIRHRAAMSWLDRVTGGILIAFAAKLALDAKS